MAVGELSQRSSPALVLPAMEPSIVLSRAFCSAHPEPLADSRSRCATSRERRFCKALLPRREVLSTCWVDDSVTDGSSPDISRPWMIPIVEVELGVTSGLCGMFSHVQLDEIQKQPPRTSAR